MSKAVEQELKLQIQLLQNELEKTKQKNKEQELQIQQMNQEYHILKNDIPRYLMINRASVHALVKQLAVVAPAHVYDRICGVSDNSELLIELFQILCELVTSNAELKEFLFAHKFFAVPKIKPTASSSASGDDVKANVASTGDMHANAADGDEYSDSLPAKEQIHEQVESEKAKGLAISKKIMDTKNSIVNGINRFNKLVNSNNELASAMSREHKTPCPPARSGKSNGKQKSKASNLNTVEDKSAKSVEEILKDRICPNCGSTNIEVINKDASEILDSLAATGFVDKNNGVYKIVTTVVKAECKTCGFIDTIYTGALPLLPGRSISMNVITLMALMMSMGFAVNSFKKAFVKGMQLGNSTLYSSLITFSYLLIPLEKAITQELCKCNTLQFDETKFTHVIKGKGATTEYVPIACSSLPDAPLILFGPSGSRSKTKDFIQQFIGCDSALSGITTDAFATYGTFAQDNNIRHQSCLGHLMTKIRRSIELYYNTAACKAIDIDSVFENIEKNGYDLQDENQAMLVLHIIYGKLKQVFDVEKCAYNEYIQTKDQGSDYSSIRQRYRNTYSKELMQDVNTLFTSLATVYAVKKKKRYEKAQRISNVSTPVVYFMNNAQEFNAFIEHGMLDTTSMEAEHCAKSVAAARNAKLFIHSHDSGVAISRILSCVHTINRCGISDPIKFLQNVASYVMIQGVTKARVAAFNARELKSSPKSNRDDYNKPELYADIELPAHLIPWLSPECAARTFELKTE